MNEIPVIFSQSAPTFKDLSTHAHPIKFTWSGKKIPHTVKFLFWVDQSHFHFLVADENSPGLCHPDSQPSQFQPELWKYDVAEFFLTSSDRSRYLEFNLAPNGAWWSSVFTQPREPGPNEPTPIPRVFTSSNQGESSWQASASIPLAWLEKHLDFGKKTTLNATFILNSPTQIFLTAADLGDGAPDFHRPQFFPPIKPISLA